MCRELQYRLGTGREAALFLRGGDGQRWEGMAAGHPCSWARAPAQNQSRGCVPLEIANPKFQHGSLWQCRERALRDPWGRAAFSSSLPGFSGHEGGGSPFAQSATDTGLTRVGTGGVSM